MWDPIDRKLKLPTLLYKGQEMPLKSRGQEKKLPVWLRSMQSATSSKGIAQQIQRQDWATLHVWEYEALHVTKAKWLADLRAD